MTNRIPRGFLCFCIAILLYSGNDSNAQNIARARTIMDSLSSASMFGRGYVNDGCGIAAEYIANEMRTMGLRSFESGFKQDFHVQVKTYPSTVSMKINGVQLKTGEEFAVITGSPTLKGSFELLEIDSTWFKRHRKIEKLKKRDLSKTLIAFNSGITSGKYKKLTDSLIRNNYIKCAGFINVIDKNSVAWSVYSPEASLSYPIFNVVRRVMSSNPSTAEIDVVLEAVDEYKISNVIGYLPGSSDSESFVVVTAHYDHLGMMGKDAYFPGANDNASGVAMMLDFADHYSNAANQLPYNIVFMALAGEEIGLKGSKFAVENSLFPLDKIKFLINLDMVGTGSEGITMVNGVQLLEYYEKMVKINADNEYILKVAKRGESCNSDHCPFYKKGVPAVFIYSMGNEHMEYHSLNDKSHLVPFTEYEDIFRLIRDFINTL